MDIQKAKTLGWGAGAGAAAALVIAFSTGWTVTSSSAAEEGRKMAEKAVTDNLAAICVAQFDGDGAAEVNLKTLRGTQAWKRARYVSEGGWATMPGADSPTRNVASKCANLLFKRKE